MTSRSPIQCLFLISVVLVSSGCSQSSTQAVASPAPAIPHIRAGGYICNKSYFVMGERQLRDKGIQQVTFQGCQQVGANIEVNVLGRDQQYGAVKIGNSGGVAWVDEQDLVGG
jgi:hypothetical protein